MTKAYISKKIFRLTQHQTILLIVHLYQLVGDHFVIVVALFGELGVLQLELFPYFHYYYYDYA